MVTTAPADIQCSSGLSARFVRARDKSGLTMRGVAEMAGLAYSTIASIAYGKALPQIHTVEIVARVLGVPPGWLAYGQGPEPEWKESKQSSVPARTKTKKNKI